MRRANVLQSLGRKKAGEMNKTESAYAKRLESLRASGEILWFAFEAITLKLANALRYTPDFVVILPDGRIQLHEVKGARVIFRDDAKAKVKMAAQKFQWAEMIVVFPKARSKMTEWEFEPFEACEE